MKAVILAGGFGTRLSEETDMRPKPLVEVGEKPILWHILKIYSAHGIKDFVICLGYKGYAIKEYFRNYLIHNSDITVDLKSGELSILKNSAEDWKITLVDTGLNTMTGGRIKRIKRFVDDKTFLLTYGDGVGDIDIAESVRFHKAHGKICTMTVVQPPGRFGSVDMDSHGKVASFLEKPSGDGGWINGGFFVLEPKVFDYIDGDPTIWEQEPLRHLAQADELRGFQHRKFWQPMDTLRDKLHLNSLWEKGTAPWKIW